MDQFGKILSQVIITEEERWIQVDNKIGYKTQQYAIAHSIARFLLLDQEKGAYEKSYAIPLMPSEITDKVALFLLLPLDLFKEEFKKYLLSIKDYPLDVDEWLSYLSDRSQVNMFNLAIGYQQLKQAAYSERMDKFYAYLDSLVFGMNLSLEKFQSRKSDVFSSLALIKENYNTRINSLGKNDLSKIDVANKMLAMIKEILKRVLKDQESRDILRTLTSIKFENVEEIYDIVQSKTKNVFVKINEKYDGENILLKTDYANSKLYCTGFTSFGEETFEFHRSTFIRNYISLYDLLTSGKIDKKYLLEFASMIGMPLDEDLQNSSEISIINKAVDYLDAKRAINKSNQNVVLKREKI